MHKIRQLPKSYSHKGDELTAFIFHLTSKKSQIAILSACFSLMRRGESMSKVSQLDLNLLILLDILLSEKSVTAAAQRVGITQSAMSHSLKRLREMLNDPLLIKTAGGMEPTLRAQQLHGPIRSALNQLTELVSSDGSFDSFNSKREFSVLCNCYSALLFLPEIVNKLALVAPQVGLEASCEDSEGSRTWLSKRHDVTLGFQRLAEEKYVQQKLWQDDLVVVAGRNNSQLGDNALTLEAFAHAQHVALTDLSECEATIDAALENLEFHRRIKIKSCHLDAVLSMVTQSDLIATVPKRFVQMHCLGDDVLVYEPPIELPPVTLFLGWEIDSEFDFGNQWLRNLISDIAYSQNKGFEAQDGNT